MSSPTIIVGSRVVGREHPPYVIAEAGVHHQNSVELAKDYIRQAKLAGADAIKFQTYTADKLVTRTATAYWDAQDASTQHEVFSRRSLLTRDDYATLFRYAAEVGVQLLSTPFDPHSADMLASLGMAAFKIASGDLTYSQLLEHIAGFGRPVLLSTGASTLDEVRQAVGTLTRSGAREIALLHCSLAYPTKPQDANLSRIAALHTAFPDVVLGYSDHTAPPGSDVLCPIAVASGAAIVEKHYSLNTLLPGDDHYHSVDQQGLERLVRHSNLAWTATRCFTEIDFGRDGRPAGGAP